MDVKPTNTRLLDRAAKLFGRGDLKEIIERGDVVKHFEVIDGDIFIVVVNEPYGQRVEGIASETSEHDILMVLTAHLPQNMFYFEGSCEFNSICERAGYTCKKP